MGYENASNASLANMIEEELRRHSLNDDIARAKLFEVVRRLKASSPNAKNIDETKLLRRQLKKANTKLDKIRTVLK
jgi:hypothetical protein